MIPYSDPDYFYNDAISKDLLITDGTVTVSGTSYTVTGQTVKIENDLLEQEGFELHQSLCSESQIRFGACESNYITFVMHENIPTLKGKVLKVYLIPDSDASKMVQIGVFKVDEDKLSSDRTKRTITAYDAMYDILNSDVAAWYNAELPTSSSSKTMAQFRADLMTHFGLTAESVTLANDTATIKRTIEPETLSGADIIRAICELNGVFGTITNEGKFRFVELSPGIDDGLFPSETLYPADDLYPEDVNPYVTPMSKARYIDVQFEDYNSEAITQLTIRESDDDIGVTVGTSGNRYVITGNPLVFGYSAADLTTVATNALAKMVNRYYKPCTVNAVGNPLFEPGDPIRVATTYRGIVTYILQRTMRGIQALRDIYTASGEQTINANLNSVMSRFEQLSSKTTTIKADVDGFKVEVSEDYVSKDGVVGDLNNKMSSSITIASNRITFGSTGSLVIDTSNLTLDEYGNASFKGVLDGAQIKSGSQIIATQSGGTVASVMSSGGFATGEVNSGGTGIATNGKVEARLSEITIQPTTYWGSESIYIGTGRANSQIAIGNVTIYGNSISINGFSVLTSNSSISANNVTGTLSADQIPSTLKVSQILNTSGTGRINIDYGSSAYNIVLNGSVNIGNGSSNDIRIKGRDVKWKQYSSLSSSDYVLVEDTV